MGEVRLRPVTPADLDAIFGHQSDLEANRMAVARPRDAASFAAHWARVLGDPSVVVRAITSDDALVGTINCFEMEGKHHVGYWIERGHWGKGIASRALALLLEEVTLRPLHATVARSNVGSARVLERCGFVLTGYAMSEETERFPACEEAYFVLR